MNTHSMVRFSLLLTAMALSACKTGSEATVNDDCGGGHYVIAQKVIHNNGEFFELQTPTARNDCEAEYIFNFRWANPAKRAIDNDMPPLLNLEHAFQPLAEFAYFPHPAPVFRRDTVMDANGNLIMGDWWVIDFNIGNKNSGYPTTQYYVGCRLDWEAAAIDSTEIVCRIYFYNNFPKK